MGAYNLLHIKVRCLNCKNEFPGKLQFKVGESWQYEYHLGDKIKVEKHDQQIVDKKIVAYGILENERCSACGHDNQEEYNIYIDDCMVTSVDDSPELTKFLDVNDGRYYFVDQY